MSAAVALGLACVVAGIALAWSGPAQRIRAMHTRCRGAAGSKRPSVLGAQTGARGGKEGEASRMFAGRDEVPLLLELLGTMLQAGLALPRALEIAARVAGTSQVALTRASAALQLGADWGHAWPEAARDSDVVHLRSALHFAASTGAPSAEILYARARQLRRSRHRDLEKRAGALGVRLVIPLGVCSLPAFLCLGVVPVLLAMIPSG